MSDKKDYVNSCGYLAKTAITALAVPMSVLPTLPLLSYPVNLDAMNSPSNHIDFKGSRIQPN